MLISPTNLQESFPYVRGRTPRQMRLKLPETVTDGVVMLGPYTLADAQVHWEAEDAEMLQRFDAPRRSTLEETRNAVQRWIDAHKTGGPTLNYAMRLSTGELTGGCELRRISPDAANISYWTFKAFRSRGFATRAIGLLLEPAWACGLVRVEAHIDADNLASRSAVERNGFVENGVVIDDAPDGLKLTRLLYVKAV